MTAGKDEKDREARLKAALRDNLKRRKQAARKARDDAPVSDAKDNRKH